MNRLEQDAFWALRRGLAGLSIDGISRDDLTQQHANLIAALQNRNGIAAGEILEAELAKLPTAVAHEIRQGMARVNWQSDVPPSKTDAWQFRTMADARKPRKPLQHIVHGLLTLPSLSIFYGAPGTLKSLLLAVMAACVAAGRLFLESLPGTINRPKSTLQAAAMWLDFDNGQRRTDERFEAIGRAYDLPDDLPLFYVSLPIPHLDASDTGSTEALIDRILAHNAKLVIIDNLGVVSGGVDENSPAMIPVMANLRRIAESTGAAIVVIHHQRKAATNGSSKSRAGDSLRGHSSIEASLDLALLIEREEGSDSITMRSTKTRDVNVEPFGAVWSCTHKPGGQELEEARFWGLHVTDNKSDAAIDEAIKEALSDEDLNQTHLLKAIKEILPDVTRVRVLGRIENSVSRGVVFLRSGNDNAKIYSRCL